MNVIVWVSLCWSVTVDFLSVLSSPYLSNCLSIISIWLLTCLIVCCSVHDRRGREREIERERKSEIKYQLTYLDIIRPIKNNNFIFFLCFQAKYVILAIPPAMNNRILFQPPLPSGRTQLCQRTPMGSIIKTMTYYPRAYWRERGRLLIIIHNDIIMNFNVNYDGLTSCKMVKYTHMPMGWLSEYFQGEYDWEIIWWFYLYKRGSQPLFVGFKDYIMTRTLGSESLRTAGSCGRVCIMSHLRVIAWVHYV